MGAGQYKGEPPMTSVSPQLTCRFLRRAVGEGVGFSSDVSEAGVAEAASNLAWLGPAGRDGLGRRGGAGPGARGFSSDLSEQVAGSRLGWPGLGRHRGGAL